MGITAKENELFNRLLSANRNIVQDGVADEEEYLAAKYKIVYILKEVNGGSGWDLRAFIRDGGRAQTWDNIARWTEAILNLQQDRPWSYWESGNEKRRQRMLKKICAVNMKKTSGGSSAHPDEIYQAAIENRDILQKQMALYHPGLIICCGTEWAFMEACYKEKSVNWEMTSRGIWYFMDRGTAVISYVHPQARVRGCLLHYALIDAVKEILSKNIL